MDLTTFILEKLGEALYIHAKTAAVADDAYASVAYLQSKGVLTPADTPPSA